MTAAVRDRLADGGTVANIGSIAADKGAGSYGAAKASPAAGQITGQVLAVTPCCASRQRSR
jgi:hypothetical protein